MRLALALTVRTVLRVLTTPCMVGSSWVENVLRLLTSLSFRLAMSWWADLRRVVVSMFGSMLRLSLCRTPVTHWYVTWTDLWFTGLFRFLFALGVACCWWHGPDVGPPMTLSLLVR